MSLGAALARGIVIVALAGVAVAGCGGSQDQRRHTTTIAAQIPVPPTTTTAATTPPPTPPAVKALQKAVYAQLRAAGPHTGAVVYDISAGQQLFWLRGAVARPPASVEKLYTTFAALEDLGPDTRLQTTVLGTGYLAGGVWHGNLYLRGGGDPTFGDATFNRIWEQGYGPTAVQLVAQLRHDGIRAVTGHVIGDTSLFDSRPGPPNTNYAPDLPDLGGELSALTYDHGSTNGHLSPGAFAVRELVLTMRDAGIGARATKFTATTPRTAQPLASVSSPPISVLVRLMDVPSDDFFAEMLAKQLGVRFGGGGTTAAGARVIKTAVANLDVYPAIVDGSGLSRRDASTPDQVVDLLRAVWGTPTGRILRASLPVVGVNGTTQTIADHTAAQGHCSAKTGSLNYVSNLAGYCHSRDGHVLAFALFLDGPTNATGFALLGRMVAAIARY